MTVPTEIPRRLLGATGVSVSAIALGGYHLGLVDSDAAAERIIHEAIDAGITFFDNAWEYHDGLSEHRLGRALDGRRDGVVVMTKMCAHGRGKDIALQQLDESLRRLGTDHLDLWQIHEIAYDNDPELHFAVNGAVDALAEAQRQGKVRFVGFTGHKDPSMHLRMLSYDYPFDTVQMPLNCFDATFRSFERDVLPEVVRRGMAPIGMKSMSGDGQAIKAGVVSAEEALRYAMSLPVAATVVGVETPDVLRQNVTIAQGFVPMTADEMAALRERVRPCAADGRFELFKTSKKFDGPIGRAQHGFD